MSDSTTSAAARLDASRKREQALRLVIAGELERERKRKAPQQEPPRPEPQMADAEAGETPAIDAGPFSELWAPFHNVTL